MLWCVIYIHLDDKCPLFIITAFSCSSIWLCDTVVLLPRMSLYSSLLIPKDEILMWCDVKSMSSSTCETVWAGMSAPDKAGLPPPRDVLISCNRVTHHLAALTSASHHNVCIHARTLWSADPLLLPFFGIPTPTLTPSDHLTYLKYPVWAILCSEWACYHHCCDSLFCKTWWGFNGGWGCRSSVVTASEWGGVKA